MSGSRANTTIIAALFATVLLGSPMAVRAADDPESTGLRHWLENDYYKVHLDVRARVELADIEGFEDSQAYTVRTRLGIGSQPFHGLSGYVEMESSFSIEGGQYFDGVESATGQSIIADPNETDLNQAFLKYENADWFGAKVIGGRQRIKLDDQRFVGNVGWRQNEQTYDAVLASTSLGVEHLTAMYGYVWDVRRIWGDDGPPRNDDWDSESHLIRLVYDRFAEAKVTAFAYLLDFDGDSPGNSSNSYGMRITGSHAFTEDWSVRYSGSYAVQTDNADNPVDYTAHYGAVEGNVVFAPAGFVGVGYEHLGSDDGKARFVTPLATAHKFNGFADAFLDNGGPRGLDDFYVTIAPKLPCKFKGKLIYHHFWRAEGGRSLGHEIDVVLSRPLVPGLTALTKLAHYDANHSGPADRWRWWIQLTYQF